MNSRRGVTLIELVIVFVIISIGGLLLAPNIGAWLPSYRLRSETRNVISALRLAQMKAVSNNLEHRVSFDPGAGSYVLERNTGGWIPAGEPQALASGITITNITFPGNNAHFNSDSTSSTGSITLTNSKGASRTLTLTPSTGRINVH